MKKKIMRNICSVALWALVLAVTLCAATADVQAFGFSAFGYHISTQGIVKQEPQKISTEAYAQKPVRHDTGENLVDVHEALRLANSDTYTTTVMKSFTGDNFCLETDRRIAYFTVKEDGTIMLMNQRPVKCAEIKTTEMYLGSAWERVNNGERISYKEVRKNVKIPFKLRSKMVIARLIR